MDVKIINHSNVLYSKQINNRVKSINFYVLNIDKYTSKHFAINSHIIGNHSKVIQKSNSSETNNQNSHGSVMNTHYNNSSLLMS